MRRIYLPLLVMVLVFGALPLVQPTQVYAAPDTENLWSESNSVSAGLALTSSADADGSGTGTWADADGKWAKATYEYWTFVMANSAVGVGTINSVTLYITHYQSLWADDKFLIQIYDGSTWIDVISYTAGSGPPTTGTTDNRDVKVLGIDSWIKIDAAQVRITGNGVAGGEDPVDWFVDTVELRIDYTPPPTVTDTSPTKGTTDDAALVVTINGADFVSGGLAAEINFDTANPIAGTSVSWVSSSQITATFDLSGVITNLGAAWDVKVTNPDAQTGTGNDLFTIYRPDPTVSAITPSTGEDTGSVNITNLAGTNFVSGQTTVKLAKGVEPDINGTSVVVESTIKITVTFDLTGVAPGDWDVVVTVAGAESTATLAAGFDVTTSAAPNISNTSATGNTYGFGVVNAGSTTSTGLAYFTVTNNSGFPVNITISGTDMSGGTTPWELSEDGTAGADICGLKAGTPALGDYTITVPEDSANTLVSDLADTGTQQWGLQLLAPTSFSDAASKSGTVTLTATQV